MDPAAASTVDQALSAGATALAAAFALTVWDRWLRRRRRHDMVWTVSLVLFTLGAGALWWAEAQGWSGASFRVFYFAGAIVNVPWLAAGTMYLLCGVRWGDRVTVGLVGFTGFAAGVVAVAPLRAPVGPNELPEGRELFGPVPRILAALGSGIAALVIVAGALWSAWRVWRRRAPTIGGASSRGDVLAPRRLATGNVTIAIGTLILSASGTFAGRLGKDRAFAVTLLAGVAFLFAGFLIASTPRRVARPVLREREPAALS
jgi:hypothetical protein